MAGSARLWPPLFAGTGNEYLRLAGCTQVYNPVGFADFLANLSFRGLPLHEPDHLMAWTEIGEFADCALYQCSYLLPAHTAEPFRNENGIEWLGFYPLFHAAALWQNQGYNANGESYNAMWIPIFLVCAAFFLAWAIGHALIDDYDMIGVPDEVL